MRRLNITLGCNDWAKIPGGLSIIGMAAEGTVWGVNSGGDI
ncbi:hypothetical protein [Streptomyces tibetensis]